MLNLGQVKRGRELPPTQCISNGGLWFKVKHYLSKYVFATGTVTHIVHPPLLMHKRYAQCRAGQISPQEYDSKTI